MDWSLVLASQGIKHTIKHDEATGWVLAVSAVDYETASAQIRLYRLENRHWRWRQPVFQDGWYFDWSSLIWVALSIFFFGWSETHAGFRLAGIMDNTALTGGEWWRLFTAIWLHADLAHLAANLVFGFLFLGLVMGRYGPGVGMLATCLAGVSGNLLTWLAYDQSHRGLGSSGVVMGALGLLAVQSLPFLKKPDANTFKFFAGGLLAGILLFVFLGTSPGTDVVAHLGGFLSGLLLGFILMSLPRLLHRAWINLVAGALFVVLVIVPWWCAF